MREFEFPSAGIRVVYRRDDLCLSVDLLRDFEDHYVGRVSERVLQAMLVVAQNVEAIRAAARERGQEATFGTWTFNLPTEELDARRREIVKSAHVFLRRVRKMTGACLTWVVEFGKKGGRIHGHFVMDRWMDHFQQLDAKEWKNSLIGRCHMCELGAGGYMWKELGKGVGRRGTGIRLMGSMGDFAGRCTMRDFLFDSPMAECRRRAWAMRDQTARHREDFRVTWEKARDLFGYWLGGKLSLGEEYDRYRETMAGFDKQAVGDAWEGEDQSLDVGFNVEDFEQ